MPTQGRTYKFDSMEFFAWGGIVCLNDDSDGSETALTVEECKERAQAIRAMAIREPYPHRRNELLKVSADMDACAVEAAFQGDPTDPEVMTYMARHHRKSRVSMASNNYESPSPLVLPGLETHAIPSHRNRRRLHIPGR